MSMLQNLTLGIVLLAGLYFVLLAAVALLAPTRAATFLLGFAGTARRHYLELALRSAVGGAFVLQAPQMRFAGAFALFGWTLLLTTVGLVAVPWRWHSSFAHRAVPYATRHLPLIGLASLGLGGLVLVAALAGRA
jgi:hypothetical protein